MKKNIFTVKLLLSAIGAVFFVQSNAGSPSRPYLVWANLHESTDPQITIMINQYINSLHDDQFCEEPAFGWIVYSKTRPSIFSDTLIKTALHTHQGHPARTSISKKLRNFKAEDIDDGLDGVVAYDETNYPHMVSIDAHKKILTSKIIDNKNDKKQIVDAFCSVIPETYRK